jgi:pyridoxine kinase
MAVVLAISSHVMRGNVGLAATVSALQCLGHEVWAVPTVMLASRPGLGRTARSDTTPDYLSAVCDAWRHDGCLSALGAVFAGYFPSPGAVAAAADMITAVKAAAPDTLVMVDPILGDAGRLYVAPETAEAIRRELVPLASVACPNLFELAWLTGATPGTLDAAADAARRLGPARVIVTSAAESADAVTTLLVDKDAVLARTLARRTAIPNGAGDVFAGLFLGRLLQRLSNSAALDASLADLDRVLIASQGRAVLQLSALLPGVGVAGPTGG